MDGTLSLSLAPNLLGQKTQQTPTPSDELYTPHRDEASIREHSIEQFSTHQVQLAVEGLTMLAKDGPPHIHTGTAGHRRRQCVFGWKKMWLRTYCTIKCGCVLGARLLSGLDHALFIGVYSLCPQDKHGFRQETSIGTEHPHSSTASAHPIYDGLARKCEQQEQKDYFILFFSPCGRVEPGMLSVG